MTRATSTTLTPLAERIARCVPGGSFELETLVRLVGIEETERIPTASVTIAGRARMLVNPRFVAEHCRRDEHLFLLVMHELWHVLLGHTTLYARRTPLANLAFDALINAGLARQHPGPEFRGFFEAVNPADRFPHLLLRPPVGWPERPHVPDVGPPWVRGVMERLYPTGNGPTTEPTYDELMDLLDRHVEALTDDLIERLLEGAVLLGDHDGHGDGTGTSGRGDPMDDPLFGDVVRRIVERWPPPPRSLAGRDAGRDGGTSWVSREHATAPARRAFAAVLRRAVEPNRRGVRERRRTLERVTVGPGPLPNAADRTLVARRRLVGEGVLPNQTVLLAQRRPDLPERALVYLDVSGSMSDLLPHLVDLLAPPARRGHVVVRQFSNRVWPIDVQDLADGRLTTTWGTGIDCVLEDALTRPERRLVIVTDGYVGQAPPHLVAGLAHRGVRTFTVLPAGGWRRDVEGWSEVIELPPVPGSARSR